MTKMHNENIDNFFKAILSLKTPEECKMFFDDVCTIKELQEISLRLQVARLLSEGRVFSEVNKISGASSATISRVNKCVMYGGGYELILNRLKESETEDGDK